MCICRQILNLRIYVSIKDTLFTLPELHLNDKSSQNSIGKPRLKSPIRNQIEMVTKSLDDLLPKDHLARDVWNYVEKLDLSLTLGKIQSVEGNVGRPSTDPKILLTLWLFATIKGIGSARLIDEYCREHDAYKWICGGVNVNYHTISDFRTDHQEQLNSLLIQSVGILSKVGVISLEKVSQDGMRVRACAGASSFRREETLQSHLELAELLVQDLKEEAERNPNGCKDRVQAANVRAAKEKKQNLENAIEELQKLREEKVASAKRDRKKLTENDLKKVRSSTTDAEARIMKMACSGFRPAYNVQFASTNKGKAIVGVEVINKGNDKNQTLKMIQRIKDLYNIVPEKWFVDGGYKSKEELKRATEIFEECKIYMPVNEEDTQKLKESETEVELRQRMATAEAQELYKERAATAEYVNAQARNKGIQQFRVKGLKKVTCVAYIFAIAHNLTIALGLI
jgi:transposase